MPADQPGRVAVVTGGNRGIGREVARRLAERGYDVVIGARDEAKGRAAAGELGVDFHPLDVADDGSVAALTLMPRPSSSAASLTVSMSRAALVTATDMGGAGGRPVREGAAGVVWAATLPDDGPTGGFFRDGRRIPW